MTIHNYDSPAQPDPDERVWDTAQLQEDFTVEAFGAPYVQVVRKSDGVRGTLEFKHSPRVYFDFRAAGR